MKKCAIAIIFNVDKTEVILVKRRDVPVWVLPGGGIDEGETASEAAIREAFEETGLSIKVERAVANYFPINRLASETFTFEGSVVNGELETGAETRDCRYFPINNLPENFFHIHKEWLEDALKFQDDVICKKLDQITYSGLFLYFIKHPILVLYTLFARIGIPINSK